MVLKFFLISSVLLALVGEVSAEVILESGSTWKTSKVVVGGWMDPDYNDSLWPLSKAPSRGTCRYLPNPVFFSPPMWAPTPKMKETAYFRKKVTLSKKVKTAWLDVGFDDDGEVYVNGHLVILDATKHLEKPPIHVNIAQYLEQGDNVVAIKATDVVGGCQWVQLKLDVEYEDGTFLDVPLYKQTDPLWSSQIYDHALQSKTDCGTTIGQCGCAMTSLAMVLQYHGVNRIPSGELLTPASLNEYFNQGEKCSLDGCVSNGYVFGAIRWNATNSLTKQAYDLYGTPKVQFVSGGGFDPDVVRADILGGNPVIVKSPSSSHWIVVKGFTPETFAINDSVFNRNFLNDPAYGNSAAAIRRYEKVNSDFSLIEAYVKTPGQLLITDMYGRRTGYDPQAQEILKEIPGSDYVFEPAISLDSNPEAGVMWAFIQLPEEGIYTVSPSDGSSFALYLSDKEGKEVISMEDQAVQIYYSPESIEKLSAIPSSLQACTL